jgi:hypothetical protein
MFKIKPNIRSVAGKNVSYAEQIDDKVSIHFTDGSSINMNTKDVCFDEPDILCNMCGLTCRLDSEVFETYGLIKESVMGNYASTPGNGDGALDDCSRYTFSLCEFCLDHIFSQFKIPIDVSDCIRNESEPFRPAAQRVTEDEWRKGKEKFFKEFNRRNEARKVK